MRILKRIAWLSAVATVSISSSAWGLGLIVGSGTVKTHAVSSSYSYPAGWMRSTSGGNLGEIKYEWHKGGIFSADSVTATVVETGQMGEYISASMKIVHEGGPTKTMGLVDTQSGSKTLTGDYGKKTQSTETRFQESTQGYWFKCMGS